MLPDGNSQSSHVGNRTFVSLEKSSWLSDKARYLGGMKRSLIARLLTVAPALLFAITVPAQSAVRPDAVHPRTIANEALRAASTNSLDAWTRPWSARLRTNPRDRMALFANATAARLRYDQTLADSLYAQVIAHAPNDVISLQSQLSRTVTRVNTGRYTQANTQLQSIELSALRLGDTLTALEAILARAGVMARSQSASNVLSVIARGDSLNWTREPELDGAARCRKSAIYSRLGNRERARTLAREGYSIATRNDAPRLAASCLFVLATDFARVGLTDSLREPLQTAIAMQEKAGDLAGLAASKQWAGYYLYTLGQIAYALPQLTEAWTASQKARTTNTSAWIALNRAGIAQSFYDAAGNTMWLARADSLMRAVDDLQGVVELNRMQAIRAHRAGDFVSAERFTRDAKLAADKSNEPLLQFSISAVMWEQAMQRGNLDAVAQITAQRRALISKHQLTGWETEVMADEAELALRRNQPQRALLLLDKVRSTLHPSQQRFIHTFEQQRALALLQMGDSHRAALSALAAAEAFDKWRATLSDESLRSLSVSAQRGLGWYTSSLIAGLADSGEVEIAFSLTERQRARSLRDRIALASKWSTAKSLSTARGEQVPMAVTDLQRALPDNQTAVVMMTLGDENTRGTAFVLTKESLTAHPIPSVDSIAPRVRRLVSLLESNRDAGVESRALGSALIAPLLPQLERRSIKRLVFLPEGVLHRLPFAVLRLQDGRFLAERFEIAAAPSATVLAQLSMQSAKTSPEPRVLAYADALSAPTRGRDSLIDSPLLNSLFGMNSMLPRLGGARSEVAVVRTTFNDTDTREGSAATETSIKRDAPSYDVLHFATHAIVDEWSGASAALALTPTDADDGLFDSSEIARLSLSASLVVLSACRTVGGEVIAGEGVRGLTTAFLQAGARSVVATAWRVNDRDVVPVVASFYQELARNQPTGAALRAAQLAAIKRNVSPSVWGAFTLVGDPWRVVKAAQ